MRNCCDSAACGVRPLEGCVVGTESPNVPFVGSPMLKVRAVTTGGTGAESPRTRRAPKLPSGCPKKARMFDVEMLCCAPRLIVFQTRVAGSTEVRPSRNAREYTAGRLWSGLKRVTSVCHSVPGSAPWRYAMPATNHFGGSGGGMIVNG